METEYLELVPNMGYVSSSCVIIKLFTFHPGREAAWYSEENQRLRATGFRFQAGQCQHPVMWLWTSWFSMDLRFFFSVGEVAGCAGSRLIGKAALQGSVTDFWQRRMTLMHALCLALHCTLSQGVTDPNSAELQTPLDSYRNRLL